MTLQMDPIESQQVASVYRLCVEAGLSDEEAALCGNLARQVARDVHSAVMLHAVLAGKPERAMLLLESVFAVGLKCIQVTDPSRQK